MLAQWLTSQTYLQVGQNVVEQGSCDPVVEGLGVGLCGKADGRKGKVCWALPLGTAGGPVKGRMRASLIISRDVKATI